MSMKTLRWAPFAVAAALLVLVILVIRSRGIDPAIVMRDMAHTAEVHPLTGLVSNLGVLLWCAAAAVCTFAAVACHERRDREGVHFFTAAALLSGYLTVDDLFMVHDYLVPTYLHIRSKVVTLSMALATIAFVVVWWRPLIRSRPTMFILAGALLSASLFVDDVAGSLVESHLGPWRIALEDGFKLLGAACWLAYFGEAGLDRVGAVQVEGARKRIGADGEQATKAAEDPATAL